MPLVGSSRKTTGLSPVSAEATHKRRFWPPESVLQRSSSFSGMPSEWRTSLMRSATCASPTPRRLAKNVRCWRTVKTSYSGLSWGQMLSCRRTPSMSVKTSNPLTEAAPLVIGMSPTTQLMAVVLPAPLCPRRAKTSAPKMSSDMSSTATLPRKTFRSSRMDIARGLPAGSGLGARRRCGHMKAGSRQKVSGFAAPYSPCHTFSSHQARKA
mmetsp:Transcript_18080/g.52663  ORF Transcript_18080/g.52663 Transcript_18080/m.52663 type:complete len:211 (+) Transcript_18080:1515-2147(+)